MPSRPPYTIVLTHDMDALTLVELPVGRTLAGFLPMPSRELTPVFARPHFFGTVLEIGFCRSGIP